MERNADVLERNLAQLFERAYEPVSIDAAFRARVAAGFEAGVERLGEDRARTRAPRSARTGPVAGASPRRMPRLMRATLVAAAAVVLALLSRSLFESGAPSARSLEEILASGAAAVRTSRDAAWEPRTPHADRDEIELEFAAGFLEVAAAHELPARIAFASASDAAKETWTLFPGSRASFERSSEGIETALERGGFVARRERGDGARHVVTEQGSIEFAAGAFDVRVAREGPEDPSAWRVCSNPPEHWISVHARRGEIAAPSKLAAGERAFLCSGAFVAPSAGATQSAPDRTGVPAPPSAPNASEADAPRVVVRGVVTAAGEPVTRFQIVALQSLQLPQVASPEVFAFESESGEFELVAHSPDDRGLESGAYLLFAKADGFAPVRAAVEVARSGDAPAAELRFELSAGARLEGLVLDDETGRPIENAYVVSENDSQLSVLSIRPEDNGEFAHAAFTRHEGDFVLAPLSPGTHSLRASAPGYGQVWRDEVDLRAGEARSGVEFRLRRAGSIAGVVLDDDSAPVKGALLLASTTDFERKRPSLTYLRTESDANGRYVLDDLGEGAWAVLNFGQRPGAAAPEYRFAQVRSGRATTVDFRPADATRELVGVLLDAQGAPAAGRSLMIGSASGDDSVESGQWASALTNSNGEFRAVGVTPGAHAVFMSGRTPAEMTRIAEIEVADAPVTRVELRLTGSTLRGVVTDGERSRPMSYAVVIAIRRDEGGGSFQGRVFTRDDGSYEIEHLEAGVYDLYAFSTRDNYGQEQRLGWIVDGRGESSGADFTLFEGGVLAVRVRDGAGAPLQAELSFQDESGAFVRFSEQDRANAQGRFVVNGVKPGEWRVTASFAGLQARTRTVSVAAGERVEVELELAAR